jgi:hypothetical protein
LPIAVVIPAIACLGGPRVDCWVIVIAVSTPRGRVTARWSAKALVIARNPISVAVSIIVIGGADLLVRLPIAVVIDPIAPLCGAWVDVWARVVAVPSLGGPETARRSTKALVNARSAVSVAVGIVVVGRAHLFVCLSIAVVVFRVALFDCAGVYTWIAVVTIPSPRRCERGRRRPKAPTVVRNPIAVFVLVFVKHGASLARLLICLSITVFVLVAIANLGRLWVCACVVIVAIASLRSGIWCTFGT